MTDAEPTSNLGKAVAYLRQNAARLGLEVLVNFLGPFLIYTFTKHPLGDVKALIASSAPPILWSLIEFALHRRIDALSMLVLAGIALSLLAFIGGGGARFLQLREKLVTALIGMIFLGSAAIGRPLIYQLARATLLRRSAHSELEEFESYRNNPFFKRTMLIMTLAWGFGLLIDAGVSGVLVFAVPISTYLLVGPIIGYTTMGSLTFWTFWYSRRARRKGEARRAAAQALEAADAGGP